MSKPIVFISGSITGVEDYECVFDKAKHQLMVDGYEVINPAHLGMVLHPSATHEDYMDICIKLLDKATHIYMLQGWANSKGAAKERAYAIYKGLTLMYEKPEWKKS